ncbi:MAG: hypothetical protein M1508_05790 [Nitrospirae bacterium]|nr:hypothetical protein [Nitrospirota bacterium]MCL5420921.1 hypothetical protein [Nitrospirota bacterium]
MNNRKFERLLKKELLTSEEFENIMQESEDPGKCLEDLMMQRGIPKHEILFCLSEYYGYPFIEYDENVAASYFITKRLDMENQKQALWFPLSVTQEKAEVIAYEPDNPSVIEDIRKTLRVDRIDFIVALPSDLIRIIENSYDVNPHFPPSGGRTPLAKVRTFLAERRSLMACYRTSLAKGRTGLAFIRTGVSFMAVALVLLRIFGVGYLTIIEALLFIAGAVMAIDGLIWYIPARKVGRKKLDCTATEPTWGTTALEVSNPGDNPVFTRTEPVEGAAELRADWSDLSPVMRRRFLAGDRTDLAEERTSLACYRTIMARARTGLAFTRTGIAFAGLGIALLRQFPVGPWMIFYAALIIVGALMLMEGFYWYLPGRRAGRDGLEAVIRMGNKTTIWDLVFPPAQKKPGYKEISSALLLRRACSPGIWATTGLALERTVLAERRNVMARLRTVMARSRTGMAFIRTGMSISGVGLALLVYFGTGSVAWTIFDFVLTIAGLVLIADGLYWHIPAEKIRSQFPYCFGDMEIVVPDYGKPTCDWGKAVFSHDEL